ASDDLRLIVGSRVLLAVTVPPALLSFGWTCCRRCPPCVMSVIDLSASNAGDLYVFGDRPNKARQLSSDRSRDHSGRFSRPGELAIAPTQPFLRLPRGVADRLCQTLLAQQLLPADARREPIAPGRLDQHSSGRAIPGFRDAALAACGAAGVLGRNQTEICHELAGIGEAGDVAEF